MFKSTPALALLLIAGSCSAASAQERIFPAANAVGRFLGYGYTRGGYHTSNGQMQMVQRRHPASDYGSSQLSYPYSPNYQPVRPVHNNYPMPLPRMNHANANYGAPMNSLHGSVNGSPQTQPNAEPPKPVKPVGPPPKWLKPYLDDEQEPAAEPTQNRAPEEIAPRQRDARSGQDSMGSQATRGESDDLLRRLEDQSPSDGNLLAPENEDNLLDASGDDELLEGTSDSDLLDSSDDDDLLLLDDDSLTLSPSRRFGVPKLAPIPLSPPRNLYKEASARVILRR